MAQSLARQRMQLLHQHSQKLMLWRSVKKRRSFLIVFFCSSFSSLLVRFSFRVCSLKFLFLFSLSRESFFSSCFFFCICSLFSSFFFCTHLLFPMWLPLPYECIYTTIPRQPSFVSPNCATEKSFSKAVLLLPCFLSNAKLFTSSSLFAGGLFSGSFCRHRETNSWKFTDQFWGVASFGGSCRGISYIAFFISKKRKVGVQKFIFDGNFCVFSVMSHNDVIRGKANRK